MIIIALKILFLFLTVLYTIANVIKVMYKNEIPAENIFLHTIGIVGFIVLQFKLY